MSGDNTSDQIDQVLKDMELEHQQMFQMVDRIRGSLSAEGADDTKKRLTQLEIFQQSHFDHEVELMEQYGYPDIKDHENTHKRLIETLNSINKVIYLENLQRLDKGLADYLQNSIEHVVDADRPFQEYLSTFRDRDA